MLEPQKIQQKLGKFALLLRDKWVLLSAQILAGLATATLSIWITAQSTSSTKTLTSLLALIAFVVVVTTVLDKLADLHQKAELKAQQEKIEKSGYRALQPIIKILDVMLKNVAHQHDIVQDRFLFLPEMVTTLATGLVETPLVRATYFTLNKESLEFTYSSEATLQRITVLTEEETQKFREVIENGDAASKIVDARQYRIESKGQQNADDIPYLEALAVPIQSKTKTYGLLLLETQTRDSITETDRVACLVLTRATALLLETGPQND